MAENTVARLIPEFARYRLEGAADGDLLEQYVRSRDDDVFAELVRRHGGMVFGVCRRMLRNSADADDAFQAAFLVLAKRAAAIHPSSAVGAWLHGVAFRTAREALKRAARRHKYESRVPPREPDPEPMPHDIKPILDAELDRLPRPFAEVLVLCDMEDRPRRELAAMLGGRASALRRKPRSEWLRPHGGARKASTRLTTLRSPAHCGGGRTRSRSPSPRPSR